jgi:hypothetical protein
MKIALRERFSPPAVLWGAGPIPSRRAARDLGSSIKGDPGNGEIQLWTPSM